MSADHNTSDPVIPPPDYRPNDDGITHVNVWSKGQTLLGQLLSNFANIGFKHPKYGFFSSMEGFWYYVKSGYKHEHLRRLYGFSAKAAGSRLEIVWMDPQDFQNEICQALTMKIEQHPDLLDQLLQNKLPLTHYFVYGQGEKQTKVEKPEHQWQIDHLNKLIEKWSKVT